MGTFSVILTRSWLHDYFSCAASTQPQGGPIMWWSGCSSVWALRVKQSAKTLFLWALPSTSYPPAPFAVYPVSPTRSPIWHFFAYSWSPRVFPPHGRPILSSSQWVLHSQSQPGLLGVRLGKGPQSPLSLRTS